MKFPARTTGCLFCGNTEGRFESEEHIVALALGNTARSGLVDKELVIPPGEVCDKCNRRRLGQRDKALAEWPPISAFRSLAQIGNRRGRKVDAVAGTRWHLELDRGERRFGLSLTAGTGPDSGRDEVARALCKVAVETRWLADPVDARSERWDAIAAAAIGGALPDGLVMGLTHPAGVDEINLTPDAKVLVDTDADVLRMACQLWVVGLTLTLLIATRPLPILNTAWWTVDPETGRLLGPDSMTGRFSGGFDAMHRISAAGPEPEPGRSSQLPTHEAGTRIYVQPDARRR